MVWNDVLDESFQELKCMVSDETLLSSLYWVITFTVHTNNYDKILGAIISHNNEPIVFFSIMLRKPQSNYTTTEKLILAILECLNQFH